MLRITITDTETGQTVERESKFIMASILDSQGSQGITLGNANPFDVVKVLMANDNQREYLFSEKPILRAAYTMRDLLMDTPAVIDITELERQAKGGQP